MDTQKDMENKDRDEQAKQIKKLVRLTDDEIIEFLQGKLEFGNQVPNWFQFAEWIQDAFEEKNK